MQRTPIEYPNLHRLPGLDPAMMLAHWQLYKGYVDRVNELMLRKLPASANSQPELGALTKQLAFEWNGMKLHELFFSTLGPGEALDPATQLFQDIELDFGSIQGWQAELTTLATTRGPGWAGLFYSATDASLFNMWISDHQVGFPAMTYPIVLIDAWEHAYAAQFGAERKPYIEAVLQNIYWPSIATIYERICP